jgi:hypothetical protein
MITWSVPLPGPFVWHPGRRIRVRCSFRYSLAYWALGLWAIELCLWMLAATLAFGWVVLRILAPHLLKAVRGMAVGLRIALQVTLHR